MQVIHVSDGVVHKIGDSWMCYDDIRGNGDCEHVIEAKTIYDTLAFEPIAKSVPSRRSDYDWRYDDVEHSGNASYVGRQWQDFDERMRI